MGLLSRAQDMRDRRDNAELERTVRRQERGRLLAWQAEILLEAERRGVTVRKLVGLTKRYE